MSNIITAEVKFPEFNINDFVEDFESWKIENHMNQYGNPRKPTKPVLRRPIAEQMSDMPEMPHHPIMQLTPEKPVKPKDERDDYINGHLRKETIHLLCPRPRRPLASYKFESRRVDKVILDQFDCSFKYYLNDGPDVLLKQYQDVLEEISKTEVSDNYFVFWELNKYHEQLKHFVNNVDEIIRDYAEKLHAEKIKRYEKELDYYHEHSLQKNKERYERELKQYRINLQIYQRAASEFRNKLDYGGHVNEENYLDSLQLYYDNLWKYEEKMKMYGPKQLTVEDFIVITYIWPDVQSKYIFLKDGRQYEIPEYVRGNKIEDLKFTQKWGNHLTAYREFLRMNPHISKQTTGKYDIRSIDSRWNYKTFMKAWVLSHYTELYDDLKISED